MMTLPLVFAFDASQQGDNLNNAFLISTQAMPCLRNYAKHLPLSTDGLQRSGRACWKHQVSPFTNILCFDLDTVRHVYQINYLKQHAGCPRLAVIMRTNWRRTCILKVSDQLIMNPTKNRYLPFRLNSCMSFLMCQPACSDRRFQCWGILFTTKIGSILQRCLCWAIRRKRLAALVPALSLGNSFYVKKALITKAGSSQLEFPLL